MRETIEVLPVDTAGGDEERERERDAGQRGPSDEGTEECKCNRAGDKSWSVR